MTAPDGALLSLIVDDDDHALHVLAARAAIAPSLAQVDDPDALTRLVELGGVTAERVRRSLDMLATARVLVDGAPQSSPAGSSGLEHDQASCFRSSFARRLAGRQCWLRTGRIS